MSLFQKNVGKEFDKDTLATTAGVHDWARVIRALRQEGYQIELLDNGSYRLNDLKVLDTGKKRENIDQKTRYRILHRDSSTCQRCGKTIADGIKLVIDHKVPVEWGGSTEDDNLWTLCEPCNLGKKSWLKDENADEMKKILMEPSGKKRIELYFELHPSELIEPGTLALVSGIRDWERTLRAIRQEDGKNIRYVRRDTTTGKEGYIYDKN